MRSIIKISFLFLFFSTLCSTGFAQDTDIVMAKDARAHVGEFAQVCGNIVDTSYSPGSTRNLTYLNFGKPHPKQEFSVLIRGKNRKNFDYKPESLVNHQACVYGEVALYRGKPQMFITLPEQISARKIPETPVVQPSTEDIEERQ